MQKKSLDELIEQFEKVGGKIDKYYLQYPKKKPSLVHLDGWYRGKNIRDAIMRALEAHK